MTGNRDECLERRRKKRRKKKRKKRRRKKRKRKKINKNNKKNNNKNKKTRKNNNKNNNKKKKIKTSSKSLLCLWKPEDSFTSQKCTQKDPLRFSFSFFLFLSLFYLFLYVQLVWGSVDEEGLKRFLVEEMGFEEGRVQGNINRLKKARTQTAQRRMDSFFQVNKSVSSTKADGTKMEKATKKKRKGGLGARGANKRQRK